MPIRGLKAGTPEFNAKWKDIAKNDPTFGESQHEFIKKTHYDPLVGGLKQDGIDISGRGSAVQDAAWSTSVQFGGNSKLIQKALAGKDHAKMSDAEMVTAIQDYKAANNDTLFKSSSAEVRASALGRAANEKKSLLKLEGGATIPSGAVSESWTFRRADGDPLGLVGLWNVWVDKATDEVHESYTMLTINADAHPLMSRMHKPDPKLAPDKRSVIPLDASDFDQWLEGTVAQAKALMRLAPVEVLDSKPAGELFRTLSC